MLSVWATRSSSTAVRLSRRAGSTQMTIATSACLASKLDDILPKVADFPARHIGPRRHDAKEMLRTIGFNVRCLISKLLTVNSNNISLTMCIDAR